MHPRGGAGIRGGACPDRREGLGPRPDQRRRRLVQRRLCGPRVGLGRRGALPGGVGRNICRILGCRLLHRG
eukprot:2581812-Lingulodinium_polyedra.AAC.1